MVFFSVVVCENVSVWRFFVCINGNGGFVRVIVFVFECVLWIFGDIDRGVGLCYGDYVGG